MDKKGVIWAAIVSGFFAVIAACIAGAFVLADTTLEQVLDPGEQSARNDTEQVALELYKYSFDEPSGWYLKEGVRIENGNLIIDPGQDAIPISTLDFDDFIFESRFYVPTSGSMAFYLRNQLPTCKDGSWTCSIKIILDCKGTEQIFTAHRSLGDVLSPVELVKNSIEVLRLGDWNEIRITANESSYEVYINDTFVLRFMDDTYTSGSFIIDNDPGSSSEIKIDYIHIYEIR